MGCVPGGSAPCPSGPFVLFFQGVSNFLPANKNVPPLPAPPLAHTHHSTSLLNPSSIALPLLRWKLSHPPSPLPESALWSPSRLLLRINRGLPHKSPPAAPSRPPRLNSRQPRHSRSLLPTSTVIPTSSHSPSHRRPSLRSLPCPSAHRLSTVTRNPIGVASRPLWSSRREISPSNTPRLGTRHRSCLCISTTKFPSTDTPTLPSSYSSFATRGSLVAPIPAPTVEQDRHTAPDAFMFMPTHQPNIQVCPMLKQSPVYH